MCAETAIELGKQLPVAQEAAAVSKQASKPGSKRNVRSYVGFPQSCQPQLALEYQQFLASNLACDDRFSGGFSCPFPPASAHRLLLRAVSAAIA